MLDVCINIVEFVYSPCCTVDMLVEFGKKGREACLVEVYSNDVNAFRMILQLFVYYVLEMAECYANVSIGRHVNSGHNSCH